MFKSLGMKLKALFGAKTYDEGFFEELEDTLIESDLGPRLSMEISDMVRQEAKSGKLKTHADFLRFVSDILKEKVAPWVYQPASSPQVFLVLGVNGVGKTTTIAKLAYHFHLQGKKVLLAAADTFRAAAADQLELHAERIGVRIVRQADGSDPGAVVYDAITSAQARHEDIILVDTAGRMHNKENLLRELQKIDKIIANKNISADSYKKFLVLDATTGQNALSQAELFHQAVKLDAVILTKYDSAAKGGTVIRIGEKLGLPIAYVGTGEKYTDLESFNAEKFLSDLVSL
ncbi:signal recognition particle-docking protein FtsY [Parasphaerochaeta coccoides]|uniref:Signal recognition particle receptor FtsY n=1 Tax=Parasphaerochaeta coccoides (strain ATCC BAA-1237 / DSM 17374 / SPN1) TaxID=760011 RepID=F4GJC7_PARC1|nr:signal recognition particle-docking protein FtsY [Parasphaerochaeta coccoides]AEC01767.1 signal recognition particle-docking protein FtsY [Parasphaerochaeta coccoides DSM 17374]